MTIEKLFLGSFIPIQDWLGVSVPPGCLAYSLEFSSWEGIRSFIMHRETYFVNGIKYSGKPFKLYFSNDRNVYPILNLLPTSDLEIEIYKFYRPKSYDHAEPNPFCTVFGFFDTENPNSPQIHQNSNSSQLYNNFF